MVYNRARKLLKTVFAFQEYFHLWINSHFSFQNVSVDVFFSLLSPPWKSFSNRACLPSSHRSEPSNSWPLWSKLRDHWAHSPISLRVRPQNEEILGISARFVFADRLVTGLIERQGFMFSAPHLAAVHCILAFKALATAFLKGIHFKTCSFPKWLETISFSIIMWSSFIHIGNDTFFSFIDSSMLTTMTGSKVPWTGKERATTDLRVLLGTFAFLFLWMLFLRCINGHFSCSCDIEVLD